MTHIARDTLARALDERYDLVREIGHGGMASVCLAEDRKHRGASDAELLYEHAAALATMERPADALVVLRRAADAGWSDATWLRHDTRSRRSATLRRCSASAGRRPRVSLPPPAGSGGLG